MRSDNRDRKTSQVHRAHLDDLSTFLMDSVLEFTSGSLFYISTVAARIYLFKITVPTFSIILDIPRVWILLQLLQRPMIEDGVSLANVETCCILYADVLHNFAVIL